MSRTFAWIFYSSLVLYSLPANAQSTKMDSIIISLRQSNKPNSLDTALFKSTLARLDNTVITDSDIRRLEVEANRFIKGNNEDFSFVLRYFICSNIPDVNKRLDYYKLLIEKIQNSKSSNKDILRNVLLSNLRVPFRNSDRLPEGLRYYNNWLIKFKEVNDSTGIAICNYVLGGFYSTIGLSDRAIYHLKKSLAYLDSSKNSTRNFFGILQYQNRDRWINNVSVLGNVYAYKPDLDNGLKYTRLGFELREKDIQNKKTKYAGSSIYAANNLAYLYFLSNRLDSASYMVNLAYDSIKNDLRSILPAIFQNWSLLELKKKNFNRADSLLVRSWDIIKELSIPTNSTTGTIDPDYYRALIKIEQGKYAEAANFLISDITRIKNMRTETLRDYRLLGEVYDKMGDAVKSKERYKAYIILQDSLLANINKYSAISFEAEQQMNEKELSINQLKTQNKISSLTRNFSLGIIALVLILSGVVYYRYRSKQKANKVLEQTLANLKATQTQLVQSEKMASLGELTAGIAHEIQNPLNFVNNFSEVSTELVEELKGESLKMNGERDVELEIEILNDLTVNLQKINHHGRRADAIVKGMLEHSRTSTGQKEPTDINALADEYLRLAYHGLRAKDKDFNAHFKTDFDESLSADEAGIGKVEVVPQDIGRVLLNLYNNAFYAVNEKKRAKDLEGFQNLQGLNDYQPTVIVTTKRTGDKVEIAIKDNGPGIPQKVVDKIFQPFFTTKPTGQGTGLGLSLSYDIIKAHGGEIKVESKEGEGSKFIIQLPLPI